MIHYFGQRNDNKQTYVICFDTAAIGVKRDVVSFSSTIGIVIDSDSFQQQQKKNDSFD